MFCIKKWCFAWPLDYGIINDSFPPGPTTPTMVSTGIKPFSAIQLVMQLCSWFCLTMEKGKYFQFNGEKMGRTNKKVIWESSIPRLAKLLPTKHQILNISPMFSIVERPVCQRQEATPVSKIPRQDKHKHTKQLHQTLQGGRQRLLVRRGPVWIRVLLWQRTTSR